MDFNKIISAFTHNLTKAIESDSPEQREQHLNNADRFFQMAKEDIRDGKVDKAQKPSPVTRPDKPGGSKQTHDHYAHYKPGNIPGLAESWMATRAGALGETFGEAPSLSQCCQQEIVNNDECSHCGKKCKEMPRDTSMHEEAINEEIKKMKKLF